MYVYTGKFSESYGVNDWCELDDNRFRKDDGRMGSLFDELDITPIYVRR